MAKLNIDAQGNYTVQPGDDLTKIATSAGLKLSDLIGDQNNVQYRAPTTSGATNMIQSGQKVHIPTLSSLGVPSASSPAPTLPPPNTTPTSILGNGQIGPLTPRPVPGIGAPLTTPPPAISTTPPPTTTAATTVASTTAPTTGTHTPQEVILAIMKDLQGQQQQGQAGLLAQENRIKGTGFDLQNNVLNNTAMTPSAQTSAFNGAPGAVDQGVLSNNQQLQLGNQAFSNANDLLKTSLDQYTPVPLGYGGLYDRGTGKIINQLSGGAGDAITNAIQNGQVTPDMISRYGQPYIAAVLAKDPGYNFITGQAGKNFAVNPETQKFIANSNVVLSTLDNFKSLSNQINRGNITLLNNGQLALKAGISDPTVAQYLSQAGILADEIGKILGSGQGSDFTIQLGQALINPNLSQEALAGVIDMIKGRVQNKLTEYMNQGSQGNQSGNTTNSTSGSTGGFATTW